MVEDERREGRRRRACEVIQRSDAFSRLLAECFPNAVRLSVQPQPPHAARIGLLLGATTDARA